MAHANPIQIQKYLKGVDYPATREQLIENAKNLGADENVCASLEQLPDEDFQTPAEVSQAFKGPSTDDVKAERDDDLGEATAGKPKGQQPEANQFLIHAMEDSLAKIELSMLALDSSADDSLKALAQSIADEYGKLGQQMEAMANDMGVPLPKTVRREHVSLIREMKKLTGEDFDQRYIDENLNQLENDLKVFRHYAEQDEGGLRAMVKAGTTVCEKSIKMVRDLQGKKAR